MDLYAIDYSAVSGRSWLHRVPPAVKLIAVGLLIGLVLALRHLPVSATVLGCIVVLAVSARVSMRAFVPLTLYPLMFLLVIFISMDGLTLSFALALSTRVLAITASVILLILTTSFPAIFGTLGRVLPQGLVTAMFFTYRALFILSTSIANVQTALHLRGGISWRHPFLSVSNFGTALAHVLVHAVETSQRMAENLTVRGFTDRIYYEGHSHD